ncbi:hypothetical protein [Nocardia transvalensis]|uniref:hypothetical protein n=1 Tax=Nocardia transvalensis TaxID=37333 RepID=UPI001893C8ED|nr:hypothetical protein [Nocardia transvalensis]MBF6329099.1 hypothetical protein [Nocardia transvalensis]
MAEPGKGLPDKGQGNAQAAYDAAVAGEFRMPDEGAVRLAAACDRLVSGLQEVIRLAEHLNRVSGFPALPSGEGLTRGFGAKGQECLDTLVAFQEAALRYKAAYLAAGKKFPEAEAANRAAIQRVAQYVEGNK